MYYFDTITNVDYNCNTIVIHVLLSKTYMLIKRTKLRNIVLKQKDDLQTIALFDHTCMFF